LRAAEEIETTQESIQDWFELYGDPGFQLLDKDEIAGVIFIFLLTALSIISTTHITTFSIFFTLYGISFLSLIRIIG
jgi:hypothetical protein